MDLDSAATAPGGAGALGERSEPGRPEEETPDPVLRALIELEKTLERSVAAEQDLAAQVRQLRARHLRQCPARGARATRRRERGPALAARAVQQPGRGVINGPGGHALVSSLAELAADSGEPH